MIKNEGGCFYLPDAVADAAIEIASTLAIEIVLAGIPPSKFKTAMPLTSYIPSKD